MADLFSNPKVDDPFDWPGQPERKPRNASEIPERQAKGRIPLSGEGDKPKRVNYEEKTRKLYRDRGYCYYPWQHFTPAGQWAGGASKFGTYKDGFGCIDAVAIGNGEIVFLQTSSLNQKSDKKTKIERGTYKIGGTLEFPILEVIERIAAIPGARYVICLWDKPGRLWEYTEIEVTTELLDTWRKKRERRAS